MKILLSFLFSIFVCLASAAEHPIYVGSTPAHAEIRDFLQISETDSIDFIRWKIEFGAGVFKLQCRYGLAKPSTPGFSNEKQVAFEGQYTQSGDYLNLKHRDKNVSIFEINKNVLHFLDNKDQMLIGNGGYSFALNNTLPLEISEVNIRPASANNQNPLIFEGRTPCQDLSALLGLNKAEDCNKAKWYFVLYADTLTGKPSHFLMNGMGYVKRTMEKGDWKIISNPDGTTTYQLTFAKWARPLNLLKVDEHILFFVDGQGNLLAGNEDFSYTLNRRKQEYRPSR